MTVSRRKAWEYAEELLSVPRSRLKVRLRHGKTGVALVHQGRVLTRCYESEVGKAGAHFMARALGVETPGPGESVEALVSTGVLFRAISIASLDLRRAATHAILARMLDEAELQRGGGEAT